MKRTMISIVSFPFVSLMVLRLGAADAPSADTALKANDAAFYPWSESSDYVRVPKRFLEQIEIRAITMTNSETRAYVLTDEFVQTFRLTRSEVERMTASLAEALHEYRTVEGKHLLPTDRVANAELLQRTAPPPRERLSFDLVPFPDEARAIRQKLKENVLKTLGAERSKIFFSQSELSLGEMSTYFRTSTTFTYQLTDHAKRGLGLLVDLYKSYTGGAHGITYTAHLDQYAPEALKPVLTQWRKTIADRTAKSAAVGETPRAIQSNERVWPNNQKAPKAEAASSSASSSLWDDKSPFVDLRKTLIKSLQVPGLTPDGGISPEAMTLFGLKAEEEKAVHALYDEMKVRFEQLERTHFTRTQPAKNSFVIRAFPEQSATLRQEWMEKLKDLVGRSRGELLDHSIRTAPSPFQLMRRSDRPMFDRVFLSSGPDWLHRGAAEVHLDVSTTNPGRDGQPTYRIEYRTQGEGGARGSFGGRPDQFPERWRHLLTPDVLGTPLTF